MTASSESVITVDCHYIVPEHAAAYLLIEDGYAALIDDNTSFAVPYLLDALKQHGLGPENLVYIIPTHLHLDHAGGTSALAEACPNATVLCHPRAVRHFIDPARLIAGVKAVYGEAEFYRLYGEIKPIDENRIQAVEDNESMIFGGRALRFLHTRGHANHHICIYDMTNKNIFTGDTFGVEYKRSRVSRRPFIVCSSAPTDFDPEEARRSVYRILETGAERAFVAHYGEVADINEGAKSILESIRQLQSIVDEAVPLNLAGLKLLAFCEVRIRDAFRRHAEDCGALIPDDEWPLFETHIKVNAQGLALVVENRRAARPANA